MRNVRATSNFLNSASRDVNSPTPGNSDIFFFSRSYELVCISNAPLNNLWVCLSFEGFTVSRNPDGQENHACFVFVVFLREIFLTYFYTDILFCISHLGEENVSFCFLLNVRLLIKEGRSFWIVVFRDLNLK